LPPWTSFNTNVFSRPHPDDRGDAPTKNYRKSALNHSFGTLLVVIRNDLKSL